MHRSILTSVIAICSMLAACSGKNAQSAAAQQPQPELPDVAFDADSAYSFVERQTQFGPRVPNTEAHRRCGDWLAGKLRQYGADRVTEQYTQLRAYDGTPLTVRNISAQYNPDARKRILLLSHWDSRPWADQDPDPALRDKPIDGANDGASGVGVILEIARNLAARAPRVGVDILFVDAEDYGTRADQKGAADDESSWCLGTQYWVQNPTFDINDIRYAVLLDMVGGKDAVFNREFYSDYKSSSVNDKIWAMAARSGFGSRFADQTGGAVVDDHLPLIRAGIPAVDIIEINHPATGSFNPTWHTHADNIANIDRETLRAVGQTLTNLIYTE